MKKDVMQCIADTGILPVINITDLESALPLAGAILDGGIRALEVTLRSEVSLQAIALIAKTYPELKLLAGTVLTVEQAQSALDAGVSGLVMPGYDDEIVDFALSRGVPVVPGCITAADIQKGYKKGLRVFKFFPAEESGGLAAIKLLSGPFKGAKFLPTGGMNYSNIGTYLKEPCIIACGGSYMADAKTIAAGDFDTIKENCRRAIRASLGFALAHVGINHENGEEALLTAEKIARLFDLEVRPMNSAVFAGDAVEAIKSRGAGRLGHVGFSTSSIPRAIAYFNDRGIALDMEGAKKDKNGNVTCVYLKDEIAGFAFHVVGK